MFRRTANGVFVATVLLGGCGSDADKQPTAPASDAAVHSGGRFIPQSLNLVRLDVTTNVISRDVSFTNYGTVPLSIVEIRTSCACAVAADVPTSPLQPGQSAQIPLEFNLPQDGTKSAKVTAVTVPPSTDATLAVSMQGAKRQPPFFFDAKTLYTYHCAEGTPLDVHLSISCVESNAPTPWLVGASVDPQLQRFLNVSLTPEPETSVHPGVDGVRRVYDLKLSADSDAVQEGPIDVMLSSAADNTAVERVLRFHIVRSPMVRAVPEIVRWKLSTAKTPPSRNVVLQFGTEDDWTVNVDACPEWLTVTEFSHDSTKLSRVIVELNVTEKASTIDDRDDVVKFKVSAPDQSDLFCEVPVQLRTHSD